MQITWMKCDSWMKFHWWNLMDKNLDEKINFHRIEFIHEIMVAIRYIPWTSICVVFNNKPNIHLHTETKKTRVLLGMFSTHYWLSFEIQLHWRTPLNIERAPLNPQKRHEVKNKDKERKSQGKRGGDSLWKITGSLIFGAEVSADWEKVYTHSS